MSRAIWKFPLVDIVREGQLTFEMPLASKVLALQMQASTPTLWAEVILEEPGRIEQRTFAVHGTGHPIPWGRDYVGTWQNGPFVWHLYEVKSR